MAEQQELRKLARGGVGGLLAAVVSGLGGLAFIMVGTRFYSKSDAGAVFVITSIFLIVLAVATLGADTGITRFVAVRTADRPEEIGTTVAVILAPVALVSTTLAVIGWFSLPSLLDGTRYADTIGASRLLAVFLPAAAASILTLAATRGLGTVRPTVFIEGLMRQGLQPVLALLAAWRGLDLFWLTAAWVVPYALAGVAGWFWYARLCRARGVPAWSSPFAAEARSVAREVWLFNAPRSLTQIAQMAVRRADVPLVGILAGKEAASVYTAASRFVAAGLQGIRGIQQMVGPQIARLASSGDVAQAGLTLRTATTWNVLIAWPIYLTCAALPGAIMSLFGYQQGRQVVVILALAMLIGTAAGPVDIALLMVGRSVLSLVNNTAALATNLLLNLILIPLWGITGAAVAWAAAIVVSNALPTWQIRRILGPPSDRATALAAAAAVATFGLIPLLVKMIGGDSLGPAIASVIVAGAAYALIVWRLRRPLRVQELLNTVKRRRKRAGGAPAAESGS